MIKTTKTLVGTAAGFGINSVIEKSTVNYWNDQAQKITDKYNALVKSGMSEEAAADQITKEYPLWKKIGARRVNALGTAAIGGLLMAAKQKEIGTGVLIAGITKFIFPNFLADLTKSE